jgi:glutamate 5-kinase
VLAIRRTCPPLVAALLGADLLVILTDVDGLHDKDPARGGVRIPLVRDIESEALPVAGGTGPGGLGTGGMLSKVHAARIAGKSGIPTVVAPGHGAAVLAQVLAGADIGTLFLPAARPLGARKHWLGYAQRPVGALTVDDGARAALVGKQKSLLPSGVTGARGGFGRGEPVSVLDAAGQEIARGLACYAAEEVEKIRGKRSADIAAALGYTYGDEVIHRDDLVILL